MKKTAVQFKTHNRDKAGHYGRKIMCLGKPYMDECDSGKTRLCAELEMPESIQIIYFEVEKQWAKYLVTEYSDPFILGIIELAMKHSWDIYFKQPMSEDLYYVLTTYMIPVYASNISIFHEIKLWGEVASEQVSSLGAAGTGFSAGVDSFYSVLKHQDEKLIKHKVTHLLLAVNGAASTGISEDLDKEWLESSRKKFEPYAKQMGLELICMGSNIDLLYAGDACLHGDVIVTAAFVHAMRKLFGYYYWASAYPAEQFRFDSLDGGWHENVAVSYVSVPGLRFYHSGSETNRIGKVKFIADDPVVQKGLTVCGEPEAKNCGCCVKCLRTMAELNAVGKLDFFEGSFPVNEYRKNFSSRFAKELAIDHPPFTTDIIREMRRNKIPVPVLSYLLFVVYKCIEPIKSRFRKNTYLRKIYYDLDLDYIVGGRRQSDEERNRKLHGKFK